MRVLSYYKPALLGAAAYVTPAFAGAAGDYDPDAANPVNGTDDTEAIRTALALAAALHVPLRVSKHHRIQPQASGEDALTLTASGITIEGDGPESAGFHFLVYGGKDPATNWETLAGAVWRGSGLVIAGGADAAHAQNGIIIRGLTLNGNAGYTGDNTFPADPATGDGWDITHKAIKIGPDTYVGRVLIENCDLHSWRGEIVYAGGANIAEVTARNTDIHDANGDAWSVTAQATVADCEIHHVAASGIEDHMTAGKPCSYRGNRIHDTGQHGISLSWDGSGAVGPTTVEGNAIYSTQQHGILLNAVRNVTVRGNTITDPALQSNTYNGIQINDNPSSHAQYLDSLNVTDNTLVIDTSSPGAFLRIINGTHGVYASRFTGNKINRTPAAAAAGHAANHAVQMSVADDGTNLFDNNGGDATYDALPPIYETLITATGDLTVLSGTWTINRPALVSAAYRVQNASTTVHLWVRYRDSAGAWQTADFVNASEAVGAYAPNAKLVPVGFGQPIELHVNAATANNVLVSGSVREG